jgi:hypothetical protein
MDRRIPVFFCTMILAVEGKNNNFNDFLTGKRRGKTVF